LTTVLPSKCSFLVLRKFIFPGFRAKRVWSLPTPTFLPAIILVPLWRTITDPTLAVSPEYSLVPRYFGFESRRFFAEPPAFLCAIIVYNVSMNIAELYRKSKQKLDDLSQSELYTIALIILIGFAGFGLGRLSLIEDSREPVKIEYPEYLSASVLNAGKAVSGADIPSIAKGLLIASKNGSKYHFPWCSGGKRISEKNKIWFDSVDEARKAGYTPAGNCKGLK
jgi:hypothetical protein